jgi:hypothetical protein
MSLVLQTLRRETKSYQDRADDALPLFSAETNFPIYDYMNGERTHIVGPSDTSVPYLNIGMIPGVHSAIGKTQSGKTSLFTKLAGNIVSRYPNSVFYFRDAEKTAVENRTLTLTGWSTRMYQDKMDYVRYGIDHDFVYNDIRRICQTKESLKNQLLIDTGFRDRNNVPIKIYPPDVYLLDSLPSMSPINDDEEIKVGSRTNIFEIKDVDVNKRIEGLQIAGSNKLLIVKLLDYIYKYNIRFILINHIVRNTDIGKNPRYIQKQMQYLKQDEKIAGGTAYLHLCTNITRTDFGSQLEEGEFGPLVYGTRNTISFVKNKNNISGVPVELIFDQRTGYNALLSGFNYIYNRGYGLIIQNRTMSFKVYPELTFTKKTLWEKLVIDYRENRHNAMLVKALMSTSQRCLYWDFVVGKPDPVVDNWSNNIPVPMAYHAGVTSK